MSGTAGSFAPAAWDMVNMVAPSPRYRACSLAYLRRHPHRPQRLVREQTGGMQHFRLRQIAKGKLADEIIGAGSFRHACHLFADRARRSGDGAAVVHHRIEIFRDPGIARLGTVLDPELHEARIKYRPGAAAER